MNKAKVERLEREAKKRHTASSIAVLFQEDDGTYTHDLSGTTFATEEAAEKHFTDCVFVVFDAAFRGV